MHRQILGKNAKRRAADDRWAHCQPRPTRHVAAHIDKKPVQTGLCRVVDLDPWWLAAGEVKFVASRLRWHRWRALHLLGRAIRPSLCCLLSIRSNCPDSWRLSSFLHHLVEPRLKLRFFNFRFGPVLGVNSVSAVGKHAKEPPLKITLFVLEAEFLNASDG